MTFGRSLISRPARLVRVCHGDGSGWFSSLIPASVAFACVMVVVRPVSAQPSELPPLLLPDDSGTTEPDRPSGSSNNIAVDPQGGGKGGETSDPGPEGNSEDESAAGSEEQVRGESDEIPFVPVANDLPELPQSIHCRPFVAGPGVDKVVKRIDELRKSKLLKGIRVGIFAVSYPEGQVIYDYKSTDEMNPASVTKVFTAAAVLKRLGPDRRFVTQVLQQGAGACPTIVLKGGGDPGLTSKRVADLASDVAKAGITCAEKVVYDVSLFDGETLPPVFGQVRTSAAYRAKVGALGTDYGAFYATVVPATSEGVAPTITVRPGTGCIQIINRAVTVGPDVVVPESEDLDSELALKGDRQVVTITGKVSMKRKKGVTLGIALAEPDVFTACYFSEQLRKRGVTVKTSAVSKGKADSKATLVAKVTSNSVLQDVIEMNRQSRNYIAEQFLKQLSIGECEPYSFKCGLKVARRVLKRMNVPVECIKYKNGSGLFDANRVSAATTVRFLVEVLQHPDLAEPMLRSLAESGKSGTLADRLKGSPLPVKAKTGTLDSVCALAGYVVRADGGYVVFAIYFNGGHDASRLRGVQDQMVRVFVDYAAGTLGDGDKAKKHHKGKDHNKPRKSQH